MGEPQTVTAAIPRRYDELVAQCREMAQEVRAHAHPSREDFYCLNHLAYMGERMNFILSHIDAIEAENERLRAAGLQW